MRHSQNTQKIAVIATYKPTTLSRRAYFHMYPNFQPTDLAASSRLSSRIYYTQARFGCGAHVKHVFTARHPRTEPADVRGALVQIDKRGQDSNIDVFVFRGASNGRDLRAAVFGACTLVRPDGASMLPRSARVHSGFQDIYNSMRDTIEDGCRELDSPKHIVFTGHSMGGSLALLAAAHLGQDLRTAYPGLRLEVHTYGTPCTGNRAFMEALPCDTMAVVHKRDCVPKLLRWCNELSDWAPNVLIVDGQPSTPAAMAQPSPPPESSTWVGAGLGMFFLTRLVPYHSSAVYEYCIGGLQRR